MADMAAKRLTRSFLAPFLLFGVTSWFLYPASFISDQAYVYPIISRMLALHQRQSFSDIFPTNGFQPLWQYLFAGYTWQLAQFKPQWLYEPTYGIPLTATLLMLGSLHFQKLSRLLQLPPLWFICRRPS